MSSAGPSQTTHEISPFYGYIPTLYIGLIFTGMFATSTLIHLGQAIRYRMWFLLFTAFAAGNTEVIGWAARLWSHKSPRNLTPYLIQTITTGNGPTFLIASYFIILAEIIRRLGPCYSRLQPRMYTIIFVGADIFALSIQGIGGGLAATAAGANPAKSPALGGNIMLSGIIIQMIAVTFYMILAVEFIVRYLRDKPFERPNNDPPTGNYQLDAKMKNMLFGLALSSILIYIRSIYRVVELAGGWSGHIIKTEWYFVAFDGAMILAAMFCLNVFHPGRLLGPWTTLSDVDSIDEDMLKKKGYA